MPRGGDHATGVYPGATRTSGCLPEEGEVPSLSIVGVTDWMLLTNRFQVRVRALEDQLSLGKDGKLRHELASPTSDAILDAMRALEEI